MNHAARPPAFSYVRSQGPRGITIRTGRESPAQDSPAGSHPPQAKPNVRIMPRWVRLRVRVRILLRTTTTATVPIRSNRRVCIPRRYCESPGDLHHRECARARVSGPRPPTRFSPIPPPLFATSGPAQELPPTVVGDAGEVSVSTSPRSRVGPTPFHGTSARSTDRCGA